MLTLALIGLITGISPGILPVLPVVFFAGGSKTTDDEPETPPDGAVAVKTVKAKQKTSKHP